MSELLFTTVLAELFFDVAFGTHLSCHEAFHGRV